MSKKRKSLIVAETAGTKEGLYRRSDEHGRDIRGDASGEWALDADGEIEDVIFFASPSFMRKFSA